MASQSRTGLERFPATMMGVRFCISCDRSQLVMSAFFLAWAGPSAFVMVCVISLSQADNAHGGTTIPVVQTMLSGNTSCEPRAADTYQVRHCRTATRFHNNGRT
eukprot:scaffold59024_cov18-Tisochrysis_lutea.AAC.1